MTLFLFCHEAEKPALTYDTRRFSFEAVIKNAMLAKIFSFVRMAAILRLFQNIYKDFAAMDSTHEITALLLALEQGDASAWDHLLPLVEKELRHIASSYMRKEQAGHILQTTALVNEAWLKLADQKRVHWQNRQHFYGIAAQCMRRILVDYARTGNRQKRGGGAEHVALSEAALISDERAAEVLAVDEALQNLAKQDARKSQIVELCYFGGCSVKEVAQLLNLSEATIAREWRLARAWLQRELGGTTK
jgi:RNA polymerase sigma factor (TIGR02999 family)